MRIFRTLAAGIVLAVALAGAATAPASAHDELVASTPEFGDRLGGAPAEIELTYSDDVLDTGAVVMVVDREGTDWALSEPALDGPIVTVAVDPEMPDAGYQVRWRVVSSDGHPISGVVPFTVGDGAPFEELDAVVPAESGSSEPTEPAAAPSDQSTTPDDRGLARGLTVGAIGAGVALAAFALFLFLRRRASTTAARPAAGADDAPAHDS